MITSSGCRNRWSINSFIMVVSKKKIFSHALAGADPGFGQGGCPGSEAEICQCSKAELYEQSKQFVAGVKGPLKGPGSFWVFNAQNMHSSTF